MNLIAIILATIISMVVGFLWYSPYLFAKPWLKLLGKDPECMDADMSQMWKPLAVSVVMSILMAVGIAWLFDLLAVTSPLAGALFGALFWVIFVFATTIQNFLYEGRSLQLFAIESGNFLVTFVLIGALLAFLS